MSIIVSELTKIYGEQKAVDNLSFSVEKNEIVGFLGPNGAGKSTTLKIATGYLPPSQGTIKINGLDVQNELLEIKKIVGYLPEHNPLYLEMYVHEFLRYSGKFYGYKGQKLKNRVSEVIAMCQLEIEQRKKIGQLSKGYRQRVGLAQALLHDPKVLILDEPTTGLDPNQIVEVRELIKSVSRDKTVIFSTHIMQEVQAVCDRAIIINNGKKAADQTIEQLLTMGDNQILEVEFESAVETSLFDDFAYITDISKLDKNKLRIVFKSRNDMRSEVMKFVADKNLPLIGIKRQESTMEDVFNELTKTGGNA